MSVASILLVLSPRSYLVIAVQRTQASKELKDLLVKANTNLPVEITDLLIRDFTEWQFNPTGAPHLWEAIIKSIMTND